MHTSCKTLVSQWILLFQIVAVAGGAIVARANEDEASYCSCLAIKPLTTTVTVTTTKQVTAKVPLMRNLSEISEGPVTGLTKTKTLATPIKTIAFTRVFTSTLPVSTVTVVASPNTATVTTVKVATTTNTNHATTTESPTTTITFTTGVAFNKYKIIKAAHEGQEA
ncbi:hypothetical protein C8J56DRAFT_1064726 [Mycena floridula]|nr:hypothetical protein C8J56DRAFT_1064726 [Mycena floridula]